MNHLIILLIRPNCVTIGGILNFAFVFISSRSRPTGPGVIIQWSMKSTLRLLNHAWLWFKIPVSCAVTLIFTTCPYSILFIFGVCENSFICSSVKSLDCLFTFEPPSQHSLFVNSESQLLLFSHVLKFCMPSMSNTFGGRSLTGKDLKTSLNLILLRRTSPILLLIGKHLSHWDESFMSLLSALHWLHFHITRSPRLTILS